MPLRFILQWALPPEQRDLEEVLVHVLGSSDRCLHICLTDVQTDFESPSSSSVSHVYH